MNFGNEVHFITGKDFKFYEIFVVEAKSHSSFHILLFSLLLFFFHFYSFFSFFFLFLLVLSYYFSPAIYFPFLCIHYSTSFSSKAHANAI